MLRVHNGRDVQWTQRENNRCRRSNWEEKGIVISKERLKNLRFADDIIIFANTEKELKEMEEELARQSNKSFKLRISTQKQ
mgnify:CR=1 FL=1